MKKAVNGEEMSIPRMPKSIDLSQMTREEFDASMQEAWEQMERGEGIPAEEVKAELTRLYGIEF